MWTPKAFDLVSSEDNSAVFWGNFLERSAEIVASSVADKWGHVSQFEAARSHAYKVIEDAFLNYNHLYPDSRPEFTPIPAPK